MSKITNLIQRKLNKLSINHNHFDTIVITLQNVGNIVQKNDPSYFNQLIETSFAKKCILLQKECLDKFHHRAPHYYNFYLKHYELHMDALIGDSYIYADSHKFKSVKNCNHQIQILCDVFEENLYWHPNEALSKEDASLAKKLEDTGQYNKMIENYNDYGPYMEYIHEIHKLYDIMTFRI